MVLMKIDMLWRVDLVMEESLNRGMDIQEIVWIPRLGGGIPQNQLQAE